MSEKLITLECGETRAAVAPGRGALITSLTVAELSLLYMDWETFADPTKNVRGGIPILFPFAGKLSEERLLATGTSMGQHGFARNKDWDVIDAAPDSLECELRPDADSRRVYPFDFRIAQRCVALAGGLHVEMLMENRGETPMPTALGWHPYFPCAADRKHEIRAGFLRGHEDKLTNDAEFNLGVVAPPDGRVVFDIPSVGCIQLTFSPEMRHLQVWSLPGRDFVCIEPFTGPLNAINTGLGIDVPPRATRVLFMRIALLPASSHSAKESAMLGHLTNTVPDSHPWTVYTDEVVIRSSPESGAPEIGRLPKGTAISGSQLVNPETDEEWLSFTHEKLPAFVSMTCLLRVHPNNTAQGNLRMGTEFVNRWWGMPLEYEPDDLVSVPDAYVIMDGKTYRLRREACEAAMRMIDAAAKDGVTIRINSAYRPGEYQRKLYQNAVMKDGGGQRYSARPGHSEHQLGTVVDLTDPDEKYAFTHEFGECEQGLWLEKNAARFGFVRSYTDHNIAETGYISEPWHWRYWGAGNQGG